MPVDYHDVCGLFRFYKKGESYEKKDLPIAVVSATFNGDHAYMQGAMGIMPKADIFELYRKLKRRGMKKMTAERVGSHRIPLGVKVGTVGALSIWEVDLEKVKDDV